MSNTRLFPSLNELVFNQLVDTYGLTELDRVIDADEQLSISDYPGMRFYRPLFNKKLQELVSPIVLAVVQGDIPKAEALISKQPFLSSAQGEAIDYSGRNVSNITPFQAALCTSDNDMCEMLAKYMSQDEITRQYQTIFPEGHEKFYAEQKPFNFSTIAEAISQGATEAKKALNLKLPNTTTLWNKLQQFRADFTKHSSQETVFNPQHLIAAFKMYDEKYDDWNGDQHDLFWRQVIGYMQRFLPANIAMDVAQGLHYRVEEKEKANRSFKFRFRYDNTPIFPLSYSLSGLGFEYAAEGFELVGCCGAMAAQLWCLALQKLMSSKSVKLAEFMRPEQKMSRHVVY